MSGLQDFFSRELPLVDETLKREVADLNPLVREVAEHILMAGGKRLRPMLTILCARGLGHKKEDIYPLACSLELLHSATLIHDDILDNAHLRRGRRASHLVFGLHRTVLAGDALLALANLIVARYDIPAMNYCVSRAIMSTASGEIEEIAQLGKPSQDKETYLQIIKGKTADLIRAACSCGAMLAAAGQDQLDHADSFGLNVGMAFQLVDDALDYAADHELLGKPLGGDLREGKITLPLIMYLQTLPEDEQGKLLHNMAHNRLSDPETQRIIAQIQEMGLDTKVREEAGKYLLLAGQALESFPDTPEKSLLQEIIEVVRSRKF